MHVSCNTHPLFTCFQTPFLQMSCQSCFTLTFTICSAESITRGEILKSDNSGLLVDLRNSTSLLYLQFDMAAPRMVLSKRRLANQQPSSVRKRRHTRVPLDQAFLSEDHPFRGPPGCPNRPNPLASVSQRPTKKQLRPANPNGRDPFQHLNDDEIHQVVSYLDPKDTESMRRVSKFWKITSEYYCTKSVLKQCLPWTATQDLESLPSAFMNLYYRRHCMYQKKLGGYSPSEELCY